MAMSILEREEGLPALEWGSADHLHRAIAAMRLAFADALQYNAVSYIPGSCAELWYGRVSVTAGAETWWQG